VALSAAPDQTTSRALRPPSLVRGDAQDPHAQDPHRIGLKIDLYPVSRTFVVSQ
jgi:hypothetical protein